MADLDVQPKKRAAVWPWLLAVLVILALAFYLWRNNGNDQSSTDHLTGDSLDNSIKQDTGNPGYVDTSEATYKGDSNTIRGVLPDTNEQR